MIPSHTVVKEENNYSFEDKVEERAKEQGCRIVYAGEDEIQLDIDSEDSYKLFLSRFKELLGRIAYFNSPLYLGIIRDEPSKGGYPKKHITIKVFGNQLTALERVAIQFALGSDPNREFLNTARLLTGSISSVCFFEKEETI